MAASVFSDFTFGGMKKRVWFRLQDHPKYEDKLGLAVNKAIQNLYAFVRNSRTIYEALTALESAGGLWKMEYPLPVNFYVVETVSIDGFPCRPMSLEQWTNTRGQQSLAKGDSREYFILEKGSQKTLILFPRPVREVKIEIYGVQVPNELTTDDQPLPLYELESDPVESWAVAYLTRGMPGQEETFKIFEVLSKGDRNEAKKNMTLNTVHSTIRERSM